MIGVAGGEPLHGGFKSVKLDQEDDCRSRLLIWLPQVRGVVTLYDQPHRNSGGSACGVSPWERRVITGTRDCSISVESPDALRFERKQCLGCGLKKCSAPAKVLGDLGRGDACYVAAPDNAISRSASRAHEGGATRLHAFGTGVP